MKRKIAFILLILGLMALVALVVKLLGGRGPKLGELRVDGNTAASVFLDNKRVGDTPYKDKIAAGTYTIKLIPKSPTDQSTSWEGKVVVGANLLTYVNATLSDSELSTAVDVVWLEKISSNQSELSVTTNPDGATVLVDDATRGITPLSLSDITVGDHTVTVTSPGFLTRTLKIKTTSGYRLIANLKLALSPGGTLPETTGEATASGALTGSLGTLTTSSSSATGANPAKPYLVVKDTPTGFLRVRLEPSSSASEAAKVNPGEKYSILDTQSGWHQIKYDGTNTGWVSGQYVDKVE